MRLLVIALSASVFFTIVEHDAYFWILIERIGEEAMSIPDKDEKAKYLHRREYQTNTVAQRYDEVYLRSVVVTIVPVFPSSFAMQRIANQAAGQTISSRTV